MWYSLNLIVAWEGRFCEDDANGCAETSCYEGVECMDIMAPGAGAICGPCPTGFEGDGIKCIGTYVRMYVTCTHLEFTCPHVR